MSHITRMLGFAAIVALLGAVSVNVAMAADQPQPSTQTAT